MSRTLYVVTLRPEPGIDGPIVLRRFLKRALRDHGLRCVALEESAAGEESTQPPKATVDETKHAR